MFFFFPKGQYPVAYTSITTKTSKKAIAEIGFESWMQNTAAYKSLVSALPQIQQADDKDKHFYASFFEDIRLESDGLNKKQIDDHANLFCDIMSSHNKKRLRLNWLVDNFTVGCIYITDIHVLGDSIEEIVSIYERCIKNEKVICVIDNSKQDRIGEYSLCDISGSAYPIDYLWSVVNALTSLKDNGSSKAILGNARGTNKLMLTQDFWNAYFLFEITMELPEDMAVTLSGMSKNSFITKCLEVERCYDQLMIRVDAKFYTYEEALHKTLALKGLTEEQFYTVPKRLGVLPSSPKISFDELRAAMTSYEAATQDKVSLQAQLEHLCAEYDLPKMLYLTYKRYCMKQDNPSKKTFSKFFHYDDLKITSYRTFADSIRQTSELMGKAAYTELCRNFLRPLYGFEIN